MARSCFVSPATKRFDVMGGAHWVEIKERLTYYEQERLDDAAVVAELSFDAKENTLAMDLPGVAMLKMATWIVDWSFTDEKGQAVPVSRSAIEALDQRLAAEVEEIIKAQAELVAVESDEDAADVAIERHKKAVAELQLAKKGVSSPEPD